MDKDSDNVSRYTQFAPLPSEEKQHSVGQFFSKLFNFKREPSNDNTQIVSPSEESKQTNEDKTENTSNSSSSSSDNNQYSIGIPEGRSLPSVLKRISNIALKSSNLQAYEDTELRQYWMPDSVSKECYECSDKFTTWRRRHHCRVCGQIFCSACCSEVIPGKIIGCTGDLRACQYCCKVVLSYLQSNDTGTDLTADLKALQENLQEKFGTPGTSGPSPFSNSMLYSVESNSNSNLNSLSVDSESTSLAKRKISIGYQEEKFPSRRPAETTNLQSEERCRALQNSVSLRELYDDICMVIDYTNSGTINSSLSLSSYRHRLKTYTNCFQGSQLVDWLINHNKAASRLQAVDLGQALLEAGYLENLAESPISVSFNTNISNLPTFSDSPTSFYRLCSPSELNFVTPRKDQTPNTRNSFHESVEPSWIQQIPADGGTTTDSEAESQTHIPVSGRIPSSSSSFYLDLDLEASTVHLVRPTSDNNAPPLVNYVNADSPDDESVVSLSDVPVMQNIVDRENAPASGWHNAKQLRANNGEKETYHTLTNAWKQHESTLLAQLLCSEGLQQSWAAVIQPLVEEVVDFIRPDLNHAAEVLDVREYVRVKTIPGKSSESRVVRGIVCSKNVAHKCMQGLRKQPRILLLTCPLVYQRNEDKFTSLEPVMMQENEYLRHATARVLALRPDVVLIEKNVSRIAQQFLADAGVALASFVKSSVLERLARVSKADIVSSVDAANIGRTWRLAKCQEFYTQKFIIDEKNCKTLMFFVGLPLPHLGCTILLRGASKPELKKLKRVTQMLLYARYNWRLEFSFLMDEFAKPPSQKLDTFFEDSKENSPDGKAVIEKSKFSHDVSTDSTIFMSGDNIWIQKEESKEITEDNTKQMAVLKEEEKNDNNDTNENDCCDNILNNENKTNNENINKTVFDDPLQCYEDNVFSNSQQLSVSETPLTNKFRKALDDTILSISPYLSFTIPFLETDLGRKCKLRKFFPHEIYHSLQFSETSVKNGVKSNTHNDNDEKNNNRAKLKPSHPFIASKFTSSAESKEVQTMLSHFRACGGRLKHRKFNGMVQKVDKQIKTEKDDITYPLDSLNIENHQRLAVLFCSFSQSSNNAPAFCVNPWIVNMSFYGPNDIALGSFLKRYCFRESYICPSPKCDTPMLQHTRRFVHHNGCVQVVLNKLENNLPSEDNQIIMWSWCRICNSVSPVIPVSDDTLSFSFAKFLELKFHGHMYGRRGKNETCPHSIHQDHYQYFGLRNIVVSFKYTSVELWEVSLPSPCLEFHYDPYIQENKVIDEVKTLALRGHEVFSQVLDKLVYLPGEFEEVSIMKMLLQKDQANFKMMIEEVQLKLTSPSLENKKFEKSISSSDICQRIWKLEDSIVNIKRAIAEACESWNIKLSDLNQALARFGKPDKVLTKQNTQLRIDTDVLNSSNSENENSRRSSNQMIKLAQNNTEMENVDSVICSVYQDSSVFDVDSSGSLDLNTLDCTNISNNVIDELHKVSSDMSHEMEASEKKMEENDGLTQNKVCEDPIDDISKTQPTNVSSNTSQSYIEETVQTDNKKEQTTSDKKSVKTIFSQLLPSATNNNILQSPLSNQEHYLLPQRKIPIIVYENEPSSIIAYALTTPEYRKDLEELKSSTSNTRLSIPSSDYSPSPIHKRKLTLIHSESETEDISSSPRMNLLTPDNKRSDNSETHKSKSQKQIVTQATPSQNIVVQFLDATSDFFCRIYYAAQFDNLRKAVMSNSAKDSNINKGIEEWEEKYIRSLSRSVKWAARGGKSGSQFSKTIDDRFILKEINNSEMQLFLESAQNYFSYMDKCLSQSHPTLLGKIVGVYKVIYRNATINSADNRNFLVMENLFYQRHVVQKFDLKGSVRNRLVNPDAIDGDIVLLDENLLKMTCESPLYILPHSKSVLTTAIQNDTAFLASQMVMDYSLLVGLDEETKELVIGIIDYIRTFTWDKRIETMVKRSGLLGGQGKLPTIVSPTEYRNRFIAAMHRYFLHVPGRWSGLSQSPDF